MWHKPATPISFIVIRMKIIKELKQDGFNGFISVEDLKNSNCDQLPNVKGVYIVIRTDKSFPTFLRFSRASKFKGKDPTVSTKKLKEKWVKNSNIIYIGKAGGKEHLTTLKTRIKNYIEFGSGKSKTHWGGRYIWQLSDTSVLAHK